MSFYSAAPVIFGGISSVTATRGSKDPEPGQRCTYANVDYVYIYNGGASDIPPTYGCVPQTAASGYTATLTSVAKDTLLGVCQHTTIPASSYGWVANRGVVRVFTSAAISTGAFLTVSTDGYFATYVCGTTGKEIGKVLVASSAATNVTATAYISC
jgi:hypothetical protein